MSPVPFLIYPHQLFEDISRAKKASEVFLIEDPLFFTQYTFHAQKILLHRVSMKAYEKKLVDEKVNVKYIEVGNLTKTEDIKKFIKSDVVTLYDPVDNWLVKKLKKVFPKVELLETPNFLTPTSKVQTFFANKSKYFFTDFYISQRKEHKILLESDNSPVGGKWSFDAENRKSFPKNHDFQKEPSRVSDPLITSAKQYVNNIKTIGDNYNFITPYTHKDAKKWLDNFISEKLSLFGDYEDAFSHSERLLYHSLLTPMLNIGLLSPKQIIDAACKATAPINAKEGFIRQVLGWREYIRLVYENKGTKQRTTNYFKFKRKIPQSFYTGQTGIDPIDNVIKNLITHGYCHHIERLMVLGSFFLLCEIDPDEVYRWFMEFFIDSYDWVMVPNVYGMSQFSDAGSIVTKPYICGSNYIKKMSDYKSGDWSLIWDGLYWKFIQNYKDLMKNNPRMSIMVSQLDKMDKVKKDQIFTAAERFISKTFA
jgi:deoxyribodipyrimidine photolyase-related protein